MSNSSSDQHREQNVKYNDGKTHVTDYYTPDFTWTTYRSNSQTSTSAPTHNPQWSSLDLNQVHEEHMTHLASIQVAMQIRQNAMDPMPGMGVSPTSEAEQGQRPDSMTGIGSSEAGPQRAPATPMGRMLRVDETLGDHDEADDVHGECPDEEAEGLSAYGLPQDGMGSSSAPGHERMNALVAAAASRQQSGTPLNEGTLIHPQPHEDALTGPRKPDPKARGTRSPPKMIVSRQPSFRFKEGLPKALRQRGGESHRSSKRSKIAAQSSDTNPHMEPERPSKESTASARPSPSNAMVRSHERNALQTLAEAAQSRAEDGYQAPDSRKTG